jgi:hypothetical protein
MTQGVSTCGRGRLPRGGEEAVEVVDGHVSTGTPPTTHTSIGGGTVEVVEGTVELLAEVVDEPGSVLVLVEDVPGEVDVLDGTVELVVLVVVVGAVGHVGTSGMPFAVWTSAGMQPSDNNGQPFSVGTCGE